MYVSKEELDAQIAAAPNPFASFLDLLVRAIADGWWVSSRDSLHVRLRAIDKVAVKSTHEYPASAALPAVQAAGMAHSGANST
jgi:hypothetical protein